MSNLQCQYVEVMVRRSVMQNQRVEVHAHEVPILAAMYDDAVTIVGPMDEYRELSLPEDADAEYDGDPVRAEYARMVRRYGNVPETVPPRAWVEEVYGRHFEGRFRQAVVGGIGILGLESEAEPRSAVAAPAAPEPPQNPEVPDVPDYRKAELWDRLTRLGIRTGWDRQTPKGELEKILDENVRAQYQALGLPYDPTGRREELTEALFIHRFGSPDGEDDSEPYDEDDEAA